MLLGMNITSAESFAWARRFHQEGLVEFYELLVDNFLHLDPARVREEIGGVPVAFHIMSSRFLTAPNEQREAMTRTLRAWVDELDPLYVSDHLLVAEAAGRLLPEPIESDYDDPRVAAEAGRWCADLGGALLLENFPSLSRRGRGQAALFASLQAGHDIRPLFDFSNAVVAEANGADAVELWFEADLEISACHISGYRPSSVAPGVLIDSHDGPVSERSWNLLRRFIDAGRAPRSLVVERDGRLDADEWRADLLLARRLKAAVAV
jgi:uncharacterized protein (UPF0276 family)